MPPSLEQEKRCWQISAIKAVGLPHMEGLKLGALSSIRRMNFFVMASFGGLKCRTATFKEKKEQQLNPYWFEMMTIPFNMPTFSENLQITLFNYHKPNHDMVATINFMLKDVNMKPHRYGPNVAVWCVPPFPLCFFVTLCVPPFPLCNCVTLWQVPPLRRPHAVLYRRYRRIHRIRHVRNPLSSSRIFVALCALRSVQFCNIMRMYESMNKGAREGVEYKGRVLLSLQHRFCKRFPHCIFVTL